MESNVTIKANTKDFNCLFNNSEIISVRYYEELEDGLFKTLIRHRELEQPLSGVFTISQLEEILSIHSNNANRIVNLQYKICPNLFKYILKNKRDIVIDKWRLIYIHVEESEIEKLKDIESLKAEVEKVLTSPICHNCGIRSTGGFLVSYRGQECIGKVIDCPVCYPMGDKAWYKVKSLSGEEKCNFVREFISKLQ